jgi:hypothetical protein
MYIDPNLCLFARMDGEENLYSLYIITPLTIINCIILTYKLSKSSSIKIIYLYLSPILRD